MAGAIVPICQKTKEINEKIKLSLPQIHREIFSKLIPTKGKKRE
jgi:hypothetical protein